MKKKKVNFPEAILIRCKAGTKRKLDKMARLYTRIGAYEIAKWTRSDVARRLIDTFVP